MEWKESGMKTVLGFLAGSWGLLALIAAGSVYGGEPVAPPMEDGQKNEEPEKRQIVEKTTESKTEKGQATPAPANGGPKEDNANPQPPLPPARLGVPARPRPAGMQDDIRDQTNPAYLMDLAQVHFRYGAAERALPLMKKALEYSKQDAATSRIYSQLGAHYKSCQEWTLAIEHYRKAIETSANQNEKANLAISLSELYVQTNQHADAEKLLIEMSRKTDDSVPDRMSWVRQNALQRLGRIWKAQPGRLESVIKDTEAQLAKNPKDEDALERLAEIYNNVERNPNKAVEVYEKLRAVRPEDARITQWLASLYQSTQQSDKAVALYQEMYAKAPETTKQHYAFQVAQLKLQLGQTQEAVAWAEEHLAPGATQSSHLSMLAVFYDKAGLPEKAEAALEKALADASTDQAKATFKLRIADSQGKRKQYETAEKYYRDVMQSAGDNGTLRARAKQGLISIYQAQGKMDQLQLDDK